MSAAGKGILQLRSGIRLEVTSRKWLNLKMAFPSTRFPPWTWCSVEASWQADAGLHPSQHTTIPTLVSTSEQRTASNSVNGILKEALLPRFWQTMQHETRCICRRHFQIKLRDARWKRNLKLIKNATWYWNDPTRNEVHWSKTLPNQTPRRLLEAQFETDQKCHMIMTIITARKLE